MASSLITQPIIKIIARQPVVQTEFIVRQPTTVHMGAGGAGMWSGSGTPTTIIGAAPGDTYLDLLSGSIYVLN